MLRGRGIEPLFPIGGLHRVAAMAEAIEAAAEDGPVGAASDDEGRRIVLGLEPRLAIEGGLNGRPRVVGGDHRVVQ